MRTRGGRGAIAFHLRQQIFPRPVPYARVLRIQFVDVESPRENRVPHTQAPGRSHSLLLSEFRLLQFVVQLLITSGSGSLASLHRLVHMAHQSPSLFVRVSACRVSTDSRFVVGAVVNFRERHAGGNELLRHRVSCRVLNQRTRFISCGKRSIENQITVDSSRNHPCHSNEYIWSSV